MKHVKGMEEFFLCAVFSYYKLYVMAILHKNAENYDKQIDQEIIKYIATNIKSNIRELEGAFNKIIAFTRLNKVDLTAE